MNAVKKPKPARHTWAQRPGTHHLRWCTVCGAYEDTKTLRRESLRGVTLTNKTVLRPMGKPDRFYPKQPPCAPPPEGTTITPPPAWGGDELTNAIKAMASGKDA